MQAARQELAAKRRAEAIVALCEEAQSYVERRDFASALKLIDQGEKDHGSDAGLSATREKVLAAKTAWERAEAVRQATGEAQKLVAQQGFNKAISLLESSLRRFPGEAALTQELASTRNALQAKRRNDAIDSLCAQAQGLLEKRDFLRALKALEQGEEDHGGDPRLSAAREKVLAAKGAWERSEAVRKAIENANTRLVQQKPGVAVELLEAALRHYPDDAQLTTALNDARRAFDALRREEAIEMLLGNAQRNLQAREFTIALDALDQGLRDYGADKRLSDLHAKVLTAKSDWERTQALLELIAEARRQISSRTT